MEISGLYLRSISRQPEQTLLATEFDLSPTDVITFGLSGSGQLGATVSGGRVFDNNSRNIYGGQFGEKLNVKILQDDNFASYYINDDLLSCCTGNFEYFDWLYCSSETTKTVDLFVSGVQPILDYSGLNAFSDSQLVISGLIINTTPDKRFRILSGDILENVAARVFFSGWQTGDIVNSGLIYLGFSGGDAFEATGDIKVLLHTNFGDVILPINLETNATNNKSFFTISPSGSVYFDRYGINTYSVDSFYNFGSRIFGASLQYISGGASYPEIVNYTGMGTGYLYGFITGTGEATGLISGYVNDIDNTYYFSGITGFFTVTGNRTGTFSTTGSGLFSGELYTGVISSGYNITLTSGDSGIWAARQGTGLLPISYHYFSGSGGYESPTFLNATTWTGYYDRQVVSGELDYILAYIALSTGLEPLDTMTLFYGSDTIDFTSGGSFSGTSGSTFIYTGATSTTENQVSGNETFFFTSFIFNGTMSGMGIRYPIYNLSGFSIPATGDFEEVIFTGLIDTTFTSGLVSGKLESTGQINFEDIWGFSTGRNLNYMIDHNFYGYYNSTGYIHSGSNAILRKDILTHNIVEVSYDGYTTSGTNIAKLILTDSVSTISLLLSGTGRIL